MNRELFEKVKAKILAVPDQFDMGDWEDEGECGTTRCIAGWALAIEGRWVDLRQENTWNLLLAAADALDITEEQAEKIFFADNWPKKYLDLHNDADGDHEAEAAAACARIDHFMETNE